MNLKLIAIFLAFWFFSPVSPAQIIELDIKGVDIGTSNSDVIEKLGKPTSSEMGGELPCETGPVLNLHYPGLLLRLLESNIKTKDFFVASVRVTSSEWNVSPGIKIGMTTKTVRKKLGFTEIIEEAGVEYLEYPIADGSASFSFKKNKLREIEWELNPC